MVKSKKTYDAFDIVTHVTEAVIESHLRVTYADEPELPTYCAAAWSAVEKHIGDNMTAGTVTFESRTPYGFFKLPICAERVTGVNIEVWDGTQWNAVLAENIFNATIGYPTEIKIDTTDAAFTYDSGESELSFARMRGTVTYSAITPDPMMVRAFLLKLGDMYTNRADVDITKMEKHPRGFEDCLYTFVNFDLDA